MMQATNPTPSFSRAAAFASSAAVMLVPANYLPIMTTASLGLEDPNTIYSGIIELYQSGLWPLAAIVATTSLVVPFLKLAGLAFLIFSARTGRATHARPLTQLYAVLVSIGRWSMLDVFVVGFLTSVVQFGAISSVRPGWGILAFAISVVLTILATQAFDPRLLWQDQDVRTVQ